MAMFRNQLCILLAFVLGIQDVSAGIFTTFRFSNLLYSFNLCTHESNWCPMPPCDWKPSHQPEVCDFYYCRDADNSGPPQRECQFLGNCQGDSQCEKTASFLGLDPNSSYLSDTADYTTDYSTADSSNNAYYAAEYAATDSPTSVKSSVSDSSVGTGTSTADNNGAQVSANWAAYAILGGVLTAFLMIVIWRKRTKIDNDQLGEELQPHGENLNGSVARHHSKAQGGYAMA